MLGIHSIAHYVPSSKIDNVVQAEKLGKGAEFITEKIGSTYLSIKHENEDTSDLAVKAVQSLLEKNRLSIDEIECICLCTQNPDNEGLPHTSAIVQSKLGSPKNCAAFDISLGCSGYVYGLAAITGFMEKARLKKGVLITVDPYSKIVDTEDPNTSLLFGDAATATLISEEYVFSLGRSLFCTDGARGGALEKKSAKLTMNGRQVFNFAATEVPKQIVQLLDEEGIDKSGIDKFILHQGSKYIVETLTKRLGLPAEKVPIKMETTGNTVSSSIPLILEDVLDYAEDKVVLISGFGVGLSWASMILHRL